MGRRKQKGLRPNPDYGRFSQKNSKFYFNFQKENATDHTKVCKTKSGAVYFDQLSGAARTQNLVELLFSAVFNLFCEEVDKNRFFFCSFSDFFC